MKRVVSIFLAVALLLGVTGEILTPAYALASLPKLKSEYKKAKKDEQATKKACDVALVPYKKGSFGFYQWVADNKTGWMKQDAEEALRLLNTTSFKSYTKQGNTEDATDLANMKHAVGLFKTLSDKRAKDEFYPNLQPPTVRNVFMARAQVQANISSYTHRHDTNDEGCDLANSLECLAWGYSDPFYGWYDQEKESFIKLRNYVLRKYGVDYATDDFENYIYRDDFDFDAFLKETEKFGETGHYNTVVYRGSTIVDYSDETSDKPTVYTLPAKIAFFGLAYSGYGGCHSLEVSGDDYMEGYTVEEYTSLFNEYYNKVYPKKEIAAYNKAKKAAKKTLTDMKAAMKPSKPKAKRTKKTANVQWKKLSGVNGYQISAATGKSKIKVVATASSKATKKKIKLKSAKKHYIRIRSFVVIDGKKIYSAWSKPIRTK